MLGTWKRDIGSKWNQRSCHENRKEKIKASESGLLGVFYFDWTCSVGDGSYDVASLSMGAGFCNLELVKCLTGEPLTPTHLKDQRTRQSHKVGWQPFYNLRQANGEIFRLVFVFSNTSVSSMCTDVFEKTNTCVRCLLCRGKGRAHIVKSFGFLLGNAFH